MGKKILILLILAVILDGCKDKDCNFGTVRDVHRKYPLTANTWFDSLSHNDKYKYYYKTSDGLTDVLKVSRSDLHRETGWESCDRILMINARINYNSSYYGYNFHFEIDDRNGDHFGEIEVYYSTAPSIYDFFHMNVDDSSKHKLQIKNYSTGLDTTFPGGCSLLPVFTNSAGYTYYNVYKYTPLTPVFNNQQNGIKEFFASKELGIVEYSTLSGITFSYYKREKLQ